MTDDQNNQNKTFFTTLEARVIASLMEKHLTTPNNYPLTLNSLVLACNQKSNREPVMNLTEGQVGHTVNVLKDRGLIGVEYGGRSNHISHRVMNALNLSKKKQAILTVLMVRSPQTLNDIKARTNRMVEFDDLNDIHSTLEKMMSGDEPMVICIPKATGSREDRYTHLLCGKVENQTIKTNHKTSQDISNNNNNNTGSIGKRVNITQQIKLEERVAVLEEKVNKLMHLIDT